MSSEAGLSDEQVKELAYRALLVVGGGADYWEIQRAVEGAIRKAALIVADAAAKTGSSACPLCGRLWKESDPA